MYSTTFFSRFIFRSTSLLIVLSCSSFANLIYFSYSLSIVTPLLFQSSLRNMFPSVTVRSLEDSASPCHTPIEVENLCLSSHIFIRAVADLLIIVRVSTCDLSTAWLVIALRYMEYSLVQLKLKKSVPLVPVCSIVRKHSQCQNIDSLCLENETTIFMLNSFIINDWWCSNFEYYQYYYVFLYFMY